MLSEEGVRHGLMHRRTDCCVFSPILRAVQPRTFPGVLCLLSFFILFKQTRNAFCLCHKLVFLGGSIPSPSYMCLAWQPPPFSSVGNDLLCLSEQQVDKCHLMCRLGISIHLDGRLRATPPRLIFYTLRLFCTDIILRALGFSATFSGSLARLHGVTW